MVPPCAPSFTNRRMRTFRGLRSGEARLRPRTKWRPASVMDPVSWLVIEPGWDVVGRDGEELGTVHEVIGDSGKDIFNGLAVSPGLLRSSKYVPAERVATIVDGRVELDLSVEEFERLGEHGEQPPSAEIRADTTEIEPER
jgi:hypothetical protein